MTIAAYLNGLPPEAARAALARCCASSQWVRRMLAGLPYATDAQLLQAAEREWWALDRGDWLEAFAAHPRIGERSTDSWASGEQSGVTRAAAGLRLALREENGAYERRFGHVYLVCATGRGAAELLTDLKARLINDPDKELRVAAGEQAKITRVRLEKLVTK
ncbi:MAG TPA: 2-oxo-4-hydroxy-4-carboxy-5-ureidoimidazoline decarboxylase [Gemmatimonadales bacterium]|nr:2-oxo-4-hydroxy-4-carboxy-5-ureidoimidazoline decarboxylase [Gemmatimonadales bacterium]